MSSRSTSYATNNARFRQPLRIHAAAIFAAVVLAFPSSRGEQVMSTNDTVTVLRALYDATKGPSWTLPEGSVTWNFAMNISTGTYLEDPCSLDWFGVTCTDFEVTSLDLSASALQGKIPSSLGMLTSLLSLRLDSNSLSGKKKRKNEIAPFN